MKKDLAPARYYNVGGDQAVEVDGYAYLWSGETPLRVGDRVQLPANWLFTSPFEGVVTRLGATYTGRLSHVTKRVE